MQFRSRWNLARMLSAVVMLLAFAAIAWGAKEYTAPRPFHAKTYPARDEHKDEKVTIAADPYDTADKAEPVFHLNYREAGLLPILLVISNDAGEPVSLTDLRVQFISARRDKITPADEDDLYRRFARTARRGDEPQKIPLPLPRGGPKVGLDKKTREELQDAGFRAKAVEPGATQAGFLFFDVRDIHQPLAGAHIYVMGVKNASGKELIFFDIPLEKYLTYQP